MLIALLALLAAPGSIVCGAATHDAAARGDLDTIDQHLRSGVTIDLADADGNTVMHRAACGVGADGATILALAERGAAPDPYNDEGLTPLMLAALIGDAERVRALLAVGASVDARRRRPRVRAMDTMFVAGETALMLAAERDAAAQAAALIDGGAALELTDNRGDSALHRAVQRMNGHAVVHLLIEAGVDVDAPNTDGVTPLMLAMKLERRPLVALLLESGADPFRRDRSMRTALMRHVPAALRRADDAHAWSASLPLLHAYRDWLERARDPVRARTPDGMSLLHVLAAGAGSVEDVCGLLDAGADVTERDARASTVTWWTALRRDADAAAITTELAAAGAPLDVAGFAGAPPVIMATRLGRKDVLASLLDAGAPVDQAGRGGRTALMEAAILVDLPKLRRLLDAGASVRARDDSARTPLWYATNATGNSLTVMRRLLDAGASVHARDRDGWTPLMVASSNRGVFERALLLLEHGASVNDVTNRGETVLAVAVQAGRPRRYLDAIIERGAIIGDAETPRITGVMMAALHGDALTLEYFIDCGADATVRDGDGSTALHYALDRRRGFGRRAFGGSNSVRSRLVSESTRHPFPISDEVTLLLIASGAEVDAVDSGGVTPLMLAAANASRDVVRQLLTAGARPEREDVEGRTAADYALRNEDRELRQLLLVEYGGEAGR